MSRLKKIIEESKNKVSMLEAEEEAPVEIEEETPAAGATPDEAPVEGAEEANADAGMEYDGDSEESEETTEEEPSEPGMVTDEDGVNADEDFEDIDKTIEEMVGITEIQHTTSSSILDFEDGGQIMYVQPMVSVQSETLTKIISLVTDDVKKTYSKQKDEITGKDLDKTKYWKSIDTLISTMVRSQLTKSDNVDGLIDEIKQVFKVLEVK
jgi:hypothetical protein